MSSKFFWISIFGLTGIWLRYFLDQTISRKVPSAFPWGIFIINLLGCCLIGVVFRLGQKELFTLELRQGLTIGFLGGLTTFSTFSLDAFRLITGGDNKIAILYLFASPLAGLACTFVGYAFTKLAV